MKNFKLGTQSKPELQIKKEGFSLIEILIAIGILAACLTPIIKMFSVGLLVKQERGEITRSLFFCGKKMEEVKAKLEYNFTTAITTEGNFSDDGFSNYRFKVELNDVIFDKLKAIKTTAWCDRNGNGIINDDENPVVFDTQVANRE